MKFGSNLSIRRMLEASCAHERFKKRMSFIKGGRRLTRQIKRKIICTGGRKILYSVFKFVSCVCMLTTLKLTNTSKNKTVINLLQLAEALREDCSHHRGFDHHIWQQLNECKAGREHRVL